MPSVATQVVAVLGLVLAVASLGWHLWSYRDTRRERVGARPLWGIRTESPLYVDIWNAGRVPVFVTSVDLAWGDPGGRTAGHVTSVPFEARPPLEGPLQVGQGHRFYLSPVHPRMLANALARPAPDFWVSVMAPRGEVHRIGGSEVLPYLRLLAPALEPGEQTSSPAPG
jgi:hypothetical protein